MTVRVAYSIQEGDYSTGLRREYSSDEKGSGSRTLALLFRDVGFFGDFGGVDALSDSSRHEIARFFARCIDCRDPVAVPSEVVSEMAVWNPRWGNWRFMIAEWLTEGIWEVAHLGRNARDHRPGTPVSARQRAALLRLQEILGEMDPP